MSTMDIMRKVRKAEEDADAVRRGASLEAREILKAVEGAAAQDERQASHDIRAQVAAYHRERDGQVDAEVDSILIKARESLSAQRDDARGKIAPAADLIYERILEHGNR